GGDGDALRADVADHEHLRSTRDDLCPGWSRPRWPQPTDSRHARRLLDRLRDRNPRRRLATQPGSVPAELHLRGRDHRPARPAERAVRPRRWCCGASVTALRRSGELLAPVVLVVATALLGLEVSSYLQAYFLDTLVKVAIVVALYIFIGNSG